MAIISFSPFPTPNLLSSLVTVSVDSMISVSVSPTSTPNLDFVALFVPPEFSQIKCIFNPFVQICISGFYISLTIDIQSRVIADYEI